MNKLIIGSTESKGTLAIACEGYVSAHLDRQVNLVLPGRFASADGISPSKEYLFVQGVFFALLDRSILVHGLFDVTWTCVPLQKNAEHERSDTVVCLHTQAKIFKIDDVFDGI